MCVFTIIGRSEKRTNKAAEQTRHRPCWAVRRFLRESVQRPYSSFSFVLQ